MTISRFGIVGAGWRAEFFLKIAAALPDQLEVSGVVVRRAEAGDAIRLQWDVPVYSSVAEMLAAGSLDFVITSVTWDANPGVVADLVGRGVRVLSETPPAPDEAALLHLWDVAGGSGLVQVAEQYLLMPGHAARLAAVRRGVIGRVSSVQVSSTHGYHAVAMMRGLLGAGSEPATVLSQRFSGPLIDPITRAGWTGDDDPKPAENVLSTIDFGDDRLGLYDFTDNQWHNPLRFRRLVVRGSSGEISGDEVVRLAGLVEHRTILTTPFVRRQLGYDLNLEGYDSDHISLDGELLWRNELIGCRFSDEELAIAELLLRTAAWAADAGDPPYPLAQASQDHLLSLAIDASLATGQPVTTSVMPWTS